MPKHISFPSIEQFRNVIKNVRERSAYHRIALPTITFTGTVKLHGTNSSIAYDFGTGELWAQSRNNVITPEADNMGFARWVAEDAPFWREFFSQFGESSEVKTTSTAVIFGEWCGQGIMKGVAISQLPKMFVIFDALLITSVPDSDVEPRRLWVNPEYIRDVLYDNPRLIVRPGEVHSIYDFKTWSVEIDFSRPEAVQNQLGEWTKEVEELCPVGDAFGVKGVGEGIVWRAVHSANLDNLGFVTDDLIFKVKGEKHSDSHVKTLAAVDVEKMESVDKFVEAVVTPHRLEKGIAYLREQATKFPYDPFEMTQLGPFLKWVGQDVLKEESDTLLASALDRKDVMPKVSAAAKQWFMKEQANQPAVESAPGLPAIVGDPVRG